MILLFFSVLQRTASSPPSPEFELPQYSFKAYENATVDTDLIEIDSSFEFIQKLPICVREQESDSITMSIVSGNDAGGFKLVENPENPSPFCKIIRIASANVLDFETKSSWSLVIRAQENSTPERFQVEVALSVAVLDANNHGDTC